MNQIAIKYALFVTVASIIVKLAIYHTGLQHEEYGRLSLLIPILFLLIGLLLGIRAMSKSAVHNDEFSGFKNDAKNGIRIAAFNAIFFSAFIYLYYSQIDADFFHYRISEGLKTLFEQGSPKEELIQYYQNAHFFLNPSRQSYFTFFGYLFMGLLYSVAIAFFINTKTFKRFKA
jgi:phosphotransferase system  glucose/maltose/N-acetylglucosamine-specific IIC component